MSDRAPQLREAIIEAILLHRPTGRGVETLTGPYVDEDGGIVVRGWNIVNVGWIATSIAEAIEPLIEREGPAAPIEDVVPASLSNFEALSDRIGDLETWRNEKHKASPLGLSDDVKRLRIRVEGLADAFVEHRSSLADKTRLQTNQTTRDLGSILQRLDGLERRAAAFDAKTTASINHFKDVNNAIERLERQVFGGLQPRGGEYVYPHLGDKNEDEGEGWRGLVKRLQTNGSALLAVHAADPTTMSEAIRRSCNFCFDLAREILQANDPDYHNGKVER